MIISTWRCRCIWGNSGERDLIRLSTARLIYNPIAGRGKPRQALDDVQAALRAAGIETETAPTQARGEAMALAAMAARDSVPLVIAAGGDGTLHEVAAGLVEGSADAASAPVLGILPLGTGNDFIKTLGVPSEWRAAVERLARGQPRLIDLGRLNGHVFVNNVGIGFDAQVGIEAQKVKWLKGEAVYIAGLLRALLGAYRTPEVTVQVDDQTLKQTMTMLDIGNGRCSGGSFWLNPEAQLDDGMLDVCVVAGLSRPGIMRLVPKVMKGAHAGEAAIRMLRGRRIQITSASPLPVHADGDVLYTDAHALLLECLPGRVRMLV